MLKLTLSVGHASASGSDVLNAKELVRRADSALYQAKNLGRNRVVGYGESEPSVTRELEKSAVINIFQKPRRSA